MDQKQTEIAALEIKIERARRRLHDLWDQRGCTDYDVLMAGKVLDELINEYERRKNSDQ
jgi:hypothetical protein